MDDLDECEDEGAGAEPLPLTGWSLGVDAGAVDLGLRYEREAAAHGERHGRIRLRLPPEAAFHLAEELMRHVDRARASAPSVDGDGPRRLGRSRPA